MNSAPYTTDGAPPQGLKARLLQRFTALKAIRDNGWLSHWREVAEHQRPMAFREHVTKANKGENRHSTIINSTPLEAQRTLASGMHSGITSPSRPWFRLTLSDPDMSEKGAAKTWLSTVEDRIRTTLARSNVYKGLHQVYSDIGPFGIAVMYVEEDAEDVVRAYNFPIGSYALAASFRGDVDTLYREVPMTVAQLVGYFGHDKCSRQVQDAWRENRHEEQHTVVHVIEPRADRERHGIKGTPTSLPWASYWFELTGDEKLLRESGFHERPFMAPRWEVVGTDIYGYGPGRQCLGDCKALQLLERRKLQVADKVANPPMQVPIELRNTPLSLNPGDLAHVPLASAGAGIRPALQIPPDALEKTQALVEQHEARIRRAYYADLWLLLSQSDTQMTAREVQERREEKLLQLGTVLEQLQDELLAPLIDRVYAILLRRGDIPPPPEEIQGIELQVEYLSIMASAQKVLGTTQIERLSSFIGGISQVKPEILDMLDQDAAAREYAIALGTPPSLIRTEEDVETARKQRQQAQAQQAAVEQGAAAAGAAKDLAQAPIGDTNALDAILKGYGAR